ncbi:MAG: DUF481 domain-containing protein [Acidobacteria bacterium]|nr:DUF481 domain-containing protein [Acidobacteriota bacterium]
MANRDGFGVKWAGLYWLGLALAVGVALMPATSAYAQEEEVAAAEEEVKPWSNEAEASYVKTSGNSSATTIALSNRFAYNLTYSEFLFDVNFMRNSTTTTDRSNVGGELVETERTDTSAERAEVALAYRQNILDDMFWYARGNWYRNRPAGISSRISGGGGIGYRFVETPDTLFVGELGLAATDESLIGGGGGTFIDIRGALEGRFKITETTNFDMLVDASDDLQNTSNFRVKFDAAVTVAMSNTLALRVGYLLDYRNQPVIQTISGDEGVPPVFYERSKTDSMFLVSLVLKF